nr:hypothetical protein [Tanacetum cinerariifolium]
LSRLWETCSSDTLALPFLGTSGRGLSIVPVACLCLFLCVLAGTDVGAGCVDVTEDEIEGFRGAFCAVD